MSRIKVIVAITRQDILPEGIAAAIRSRADMVLVGDTYHGLARAEQVLASLAPGEPAALVLVGPSQETAEPAEASIRKRKDLVVLRVAIPGKPGDAEEPVIIAVHGIGLPELVEELRSLVDRVGASSRERIRLVQLPPVSRPPAAAQPHAPPPPDARPLLAVALNWIHEVLRGAVDALPEARGDVHWFSLTRATLLHELDERARAGPAEPASRLVAVEGALESALAATDARDEPLAAASQVMALSFLEFRFMLLALAPELDPVYQRCVGLLLDDASRRVGTLGLYCALLGSPSEVRRALAESGNLARWRILDVPAGGVPASDEPLRLEAPLCGWLLGKRGALAHDARVRRGLRLTGWPGASLLDRPLERRRAAALIEDVRADAAPRWLVMGGDDPAGWRALLEWGAFLSESRPIRVEAARLTTLDVGEIEESGVRLGRLARLTRWPLVVDAVALGAASADDDAMRLLLAAIGSTRAPAGVITTDEPRVLRLLGSAGYALRDEPALDSDARVEAVRAAAKAADAFLTEDVARDVAQQYPLRVDGLEQAARLACARPLAFEARDPRAARFVAACKEVAAEGISRLAERIEPVFRLDDVVLPADRKQQLVEIVDSVRLAPKVLDGWKFRDQLPYGRGITVLFHGPSGTGKTMAAMGVARGLGVQLLRLDLSRVVSKYIGDTEKNVDQVFDDAKRSGSAILIDEADALLGKRSEVKDAHDRYANIEVAFLLQRMEAYEGLAILTTNLRQNLDPAFLRRLRFVIEFPRPDAEAREKIWRRCLPQGSHELDDAAFRQLGRRMDLTGGHIRNITLRAAFIAAAADKPIGLAHVAHAARAEYAKLGMPPVEIDLGDKRRAA